MLNVGIATKTEKNLVRSAAFADDTSCWHSSSDSQVVHLLAKSVQIGTGSFLNSFLHKLSVNGFANIWSFPSEFSNRRVHDFISVQCDKFWTCFLEGVAYLFLIHKTEESLEMYEELFLFCS